MTEEDDIQIELGGPFAEAVLAALPEEAEVDVGLATGFGGERIIKLIASVGPKAVAALKRLVDALVGVDRVTSVKITRNSVEIGSMRAADAAAIRELIHDVLDRLDPPAAASGVKAEAGGPPAQ